MAVGKGAFPRAPQPTQITWRWRHPAWHLSQGSSPHLKTEAFLCLPVEWAQRPHLYSPCRQPSQTLPFTSSRLCLCLNHLPHPFPALPKSSCHLLQEAAVAYHSWHRGPPCTSGVAPSSIIITLHSEVLPPFKAGSSLQAGTVSE